MVIFLVGMGLVGLGVVVPHTSGILRPSVIRETVKVLLWIVVRCIVACNERAWEHGPGYDPDINFLQVVNTYCIEHDIKHRVWNQLEFISICIRSSSFITCFCRSTTARIGLPCWQSVGKTTSKKCQSTAWLRSSSFALTIRLGLESDWSQSNAHRHNHRPNLCGCGPSGCTCLLLWIPTSLGSGTCNTILEINICTYGTYGAMPTLQGSITNIFWGRKWSRFVWKRLSFRFNSFCRNWFLHLLGIYVAAFTIDLCIFF